MRTITQWNEGWRFAKTAQIPAQLPQDWQPVCLPHTWNAVDGQDGGNDYWRGTAMYAKAFPRPALVAGERAWLEFLGAAMTAVVTLNGKELARHEGGYSTFRVDITDALQEENLLCVAVDNGVNDHVYPQKADFTFYGGLYRQVRLITVPADHFALGYHGAPAIQVTPEVDLDGQIARVKIETWQVGSCPVRLEIQGLPGAVRVNPDAEGRAEAVLTIEHVRLWDGTADPYLYTAVATLLSDGDEADQIRARFGCRTIRFDPEEGFFLNGRAYPLRGVSRHQDRADVGNALTLDHHREDIQTILEIGANTVRLAHYQHAQEFYDLCDEHGLVVWAEIPYITQHMPNGRRNTLEQMTELVLQNYNHPSIVCWGLSNEITASGEATQDLLENHRLLNDLCHRLDQTRPTTMAHVFMLETDSPLIPIADIGSYNLYFGWYLGELEQNDRFFDDYHRKFPRRVMGFSEYGADANPAYQSEKPERGDYTESYQCLYHEHLLNMIDRRPWLWATHVWNLFDFAADGRDEGGKKGVNQKGLVSMDRKLKKDAFYLYKAAWNQTEPFVHICGRRYVHRHGAQTQVKVYSNQSHVRLYVDGIPFAAQQGQRVFTFQVPLTGEHTITAEADGCCDTITVRHVEQPDSAYTIAQRTQIVNWFDQEELRPDRFSIRDTLGVLMAHPDTAPIVGAMMEKARASRGDVAKAASSNRNLERMMAGLSLESLLKQAGGAIPAEAVRQLNAALQKVPKS